jgi:hypothetical protein
MAEKNDRDVSDADQEQASAGRKNLQR